MEKVVRQRRSESAWREILERHEHSGLTVAAFCEREGIKSGSLYGWRARMSEEPEGTVAAAPAAPVKRKDGENGSSGFIDLGSLGSRSRFEVRLELGGGVLLHLVRG